MTVPATPGAHGASDGLVRLHPASGARRVADRGRPGAEGG
jgi:hypothetical protein